MKEKGIVGLMKKFKRKVYLEEDFGILKFNMIIFVGVVKFKGKKKGKVFVDDRVCLNIYGVFLLC